MYRLLQVDWIFGKESMSQEPKWLLGTLATFTALSCNQSVCHRRSSLAGMLNREDLPSSRRNHANDLAVGSRN